MKPELAEKIFALIEAQSEVQPTGMEFEMAYQGRVAIDRIRFAIKHTEQFAPHQQQMREACLQLLDALQRLETVDRRFQKRSQVAGARENRRSGTAAMDDFSAHEKRSVREGNGRTSRD